MQQKAFQACQPCLISKDLLNVLYDVSSVPALYKMQILSCTQICLLILFNSVPVILALCVFNAVLPHMACSMRIWLSTPIPLVPVN